VVIAVAVGFGRRFLPDLSPTSLPDDFSTHLDTLVDHYRLDSGFFRLRVADSSNLVRTRPAELDLPHGVRLIGVQGADGLPAGADQEVRTGDVLVVTGPSEGISGLASAHGLTVTTTPLTRSTRAALLGRDKGVAEVVVPPRSALVGQTFFPGLVRSGVTVLAVRRFGKDKDRPVALAEGDMLLLHGTWSAVESLSEDADVLLVDSPEQVRRQTVALGATAWRALAVLAVTVVLLASGAVSPAVAGLIGATGMVLTRVVGVQQAYRAVSWQTVVLVGGLIPLSVAIQDSGAADLVADLIVGLVGGASPHLLLVALFLLTAVLGQVISNTATVLIVTPIAVSAAAESGIALAPVLMLVAVAGAASFLTPIATPANMIVMGPGGYRFGDYWKLGIVTMAGWLVVAVLLIPVVWPFA
jgi:di/tricarboxylate transporter